MKRELSILLVFIIVLTMFPLGVLTVSAASQAESMISIAKAEEGNTNGSKYTFGAGNVNWCAYFISWCARQAGISESIIPTTGSTSGFDNFGTIHNTSSGYSPKCGDIAVYDYGESTPQHVAITDGNGKYIHGNFDKNYNGIYMVTIKTNSSAGGYQPKYYVSPNYEDISETTVFANNQYVKIGENVTFGFDVSGATNLVLYIYLNGIKQFEGMFYPGDTYTTNFSNAGHYNYGIIANYNGNYVESVWKTVIVVNPSVLTNKETYKMGENATFSFDVAESTNFILYVYLDGIKQYEGMFVSGETYTRTLSATGQYNFGIVVNYSGKNIESTWHSFVVSNITQIGDINCDGVINSVDALMALQAAAGNISLDETQILASDVTNDGKTSALDALKILQYASGLITSFS